MTFTLLSSGCIQQPPAFLLPRRSAKPPRRGRAATLVARGKSSETASGYAVEGNSPTSPKGWEIVSTVLRKNKTKLITPAELAAAQKRGAVVIDIRPSNEFAGRSGHVSGAVSAEFFRLIEGWGIEKIIRRCTFAFFGLLGTEYNEDFLAEVEAATRNKRAAIVLYCNIGGSLEPTGASKWGRQSRSLTAAYDLQGAGFSNVTVLEGGYNAYLKMDLPTEA